MNIFVTGSPGVGKTTLIRRVVERLAASSDPPCLRGFYTEECRHAGDRIGFDIVTLDGRRAPLSRTAGFRPSQSSDPSSTAEILPPPDAASQPLAKRTRSGGNGMSGDSNSQSAGKGTEQLVAVTRTEARQAEAPGRAREGRVGKYVVDINAVESFLLPLLSPDTSERGQRLGTGGGRIQGFEGRGSDAQERVIASDTEERGSGSDKQVRGRVMWVVDEVGKMELLCPSFFPAVCLLLNGPAVVLGSIPVPKCGRDIEEVARIRARMDVELFEVTKASRDSMADAVLQRVLRALSC